MKKFRFVTKTWSDEEQRWIEFWTSVIATDSKQALEKFIRLGKTGEIVDITEFELDNPIGVSIK